MPGFRYSLNSSTIKPTPIVEKIRIAAESGYEGIELWHADIDLHIEQGGSLKEIRRAIDESGLEVPTTVMLKGWCEPDGPADSEGMVECRRRMEHSVALGARHAVAGPPHSGVDFELAAERYARLLETGLSMGVRPAMEYLGFAREVNSIDDALRIMLGSKHPEATIVLDPFHDFRGGGGHESIAKLTAKQIAVCHFDDAPANPPPQEQHDPDRVMPGEGVIDLKRFVALLRQVGYEGFISLELFREDLWQSDPLQVAQAGLAAMKHICESKEGD